MRVLIVSAYPPDPAPEANHALHISEHLAEAGVDVHVLCKRGSIAVGTRRNIVVHPVIADWTWSDLPRVVRCLRRSRPDVVLLLYIGWVYDNEPMITFLPTICKAALPGVPCVTQFEIVDLGTPRRSLSTRALRKAAALLAGWKNVHYLFGTLLRDSARVIALSSPHRARLLAHDPAVEEKSAVMPPPPLIRVCGDDPATTRRRTREAIGAAENDFVLMYWGYIYPGKGVETLLEAFRMVCDRHPGMRLLIVGGSLDVPTGPISRDYFQTVRQLPEELGIAERVVWTGHFTWDSDAGSRYLHAGDLCVLPFHYGVTLNNSSLAAAATHGLPVIATELSKGRDEALEHGRNIYLCRARDAQALAEAIDLIGHSTELRERLRAGIRGLAADWHRWDRMTQRMIGILGSAIPRRRSGDQPVGPANAIRRSSSTWSELDADVGGGATPLVSVIVAAYNVGQYLSHCLDSLVNQTLKNVEIIVVDDASQDNSAAILSEYKARHPHLVRVVTCEHNMGLASVRNIGMRLARGEYIAFTDGDDWADIRMCEVTYQRAHDDGSDVVIADATVFYEDSKTFGPFFDQHIRRALDPQLRATPFELSRDLRVMLLEPVAWTKLYRRTFLQKHALEFEDGMNSYEDICFHFSVLLKATRISLLDTALFFYRQNRPGQISARTNRKVFEVFEVFDAIRKNLTTWEVSPDIWMLLARVQLRQFDWLLKDRVQSRHKREFLASAAKQLRMIPESATRRFLRQATPEELSRFVCMRRSWLYAYERVARGEWPLLRLVCLVLNGRRPGVHRRLGFGRLRQRARSVARSFVETLRGSATLAARPEAIEARSAELHELTARGEEPLVEVRQVHEQELVLARPDKAGLSDALRRMETDYYLSRAAIFREGDIVVDVGAHVGVVSIYLGRKYPFIRVYAVEPEPTNFECLKRNIELNGAWNVTAINKAVSEDGQKRRLSEAAAVFTTTEAGPARSRLADRMRGHGWKHLRDAGRRRPGPRWAHVVFVGQAARLCPSSAASRALGRPRACRPNRGRPQRDRTGSGRPA